MDALVERLESAADVLVTVRRGVPELAASAVGFGADLPGRSGRLGRELHAHWQAALDARAAEASAAAARLDELAAAVHGTSLRYDETDAAAAARFTGTDTRWGA